MTANSTHVGSAGSRSRHVDCRVLLLLVGFLACSREDHESRSGSVALAAPVSSAGTVGVELDSERPKRTSWFHAIDDYLADPELNPSGRTLSPAESESVQQAFADASAELDAIEKEFSQAQVAVARKHVDAGTAEVYVAGKSDTRKGDYAAVVIAMFEQSGPWLVRIRADELPEFAAWQAMRDATRARAIDHLRGFLVGDRRDRQEVSTPFESPEPPDRIPR